MTPLPNNELKRYEKPALTFEAQTELLAQRGMLFGDRSCAISDLQRISYYRLSAYWYPFKREGDNFEPGTKFEQATRLYEFDRRLRLISLDAIERFEVHARTQITYHLGHTYGAFGYFEPTNFQRKFDHADWLEKFQDEAKRSHETFVEHFQSKYEGFPRLPIWMASELMSLGCLSRLVEGLARKDRAVLAIEWGINGRLWNRELAIRPQLPKNDPELSVLNNGRVFAVLSILKRATRSDPDAGAWTHKVASLLSEMEGDPQLLRSLGAPLQWGPKSFEQGAS